MRTEAILIITPTVDELKAYLTKIHKGEKPLNVEKITKAATLLTSRKTGAGVKYTTLRFVAVSWLTGNNVFDQLAEK